MEENSLEKSNTSTLKAQEGKVRDQILLTTTVLAHSVAFSPSVMRFHYHIIFVLVNN